MKIRTDFVTNSSSSCDVIVLVKTKAGKSYAGAFLGEDVGFFEGGITQNNDFTLKAALDSTDGKALLRVLDEAYDGLFTMFEDERLFEEYDKGNYKASHIRENDIDAEVGGQNEVEALSVDEIKSVKLIESLSGDANGGDGELELDFEAKTEHIKTMYYYSDESGRAYEAIRHLETDEIEVLRDEDVDFDYDEDDEDWNE